MTRLTYAEAEHAGGYSHDTTVVWHFDEHSVTFYQADSDEVQQALSEGLVIGSYEALVIPPPSIDDYTTAIATMLDRKAKDRRYDNAVSIATYVGSTNSEWAAEAEAFVAWRDQIWTYCYAEMDRVQAGTRPQPTVADFLTELSAAFSLTWPA